jgi:hypothetical protein
MRGWECRNDGCGTSDGPAPTSWPHPCRLCGQPVDPMFEEPWAHEALGFELRHDLTSSDPSRRRYAEVHQHVWAYRDARLRSDPVAAETAWLSYRQVTHQRGLDRPGANSSLYGFVDVAAEYDDIDRGAAAILDWYPFIDTSAIGRDDTRRWDARNFVSMCIAVLERPASIDHPCEAALEAAMRDVAHRIEGELMDDHRRGFRRVGEIRAFHRSGAAITRIRRSPAAIYDDLPTLSVHPPTRPTLGSATDVIGALGTNPRLVVEFADAAIDTAQTHDDTVLLDLLIRQLELDRVAPGLMYLLRARRQLISGDLQGALSELDLALEATDVLAQWLRPQAHATRALLNVLVDPWALDSGITECRTGRELGLQRRRLTGADAALARLLLRRAERPGTPVAQRMADVREAVLLARRRCRPWQRPGSDDRLLLQEALAAHDALSGGGHTAERHRAWNRSVNAPGDIAARARLAAAWAQWATGTGIPEFAAEAYQHLVTLVAQDSATRYGIGPKQRVLAAAQEYAEEAGYWLSRTGRYREAVVTLETGRAVGLTEMLSRDRIALTAQLRTAGRVDLIDAYRHATEKFAELDRQASPHRRQAWDDLCDLARQITETTGSNPLITGVRYDDITAETGDGALVYIAAAKAGGYALIVAADHDPQFIDLPKLDHATVAALVGDITSATLTPTGIADAPEGADTISPARDIEPESAQRLVDPTAAVLDELWASGVGDFLWIDASGRIVTLIPVGLLGLLPLHATGDLDTYADPHSQRNHAGRFGATRYAPNARSLRRCRDTAAQLGTQHQLLAVDVPDGFGAGAAAHLYHVARETDEITRRWTGQTQRVAHDCTWEEFRTAADDHTVWHLACHGSAEPDAIMNSRLYFADRQVTLDELQTALRPRPRRLAVLSACDTNLSDAAVPNEIVGLPSALLQAGFAGVIAAAWKVDDLATTYLMTMFYQRWCQEGDEPPIALNRAQQWLRTATRSQLRALIAEIEPQGDPGEHPYLHPRYWAAFAYTGA